MSTRSVHDNLVVSYEVDCRARRLTIHTEYYDPAAARVTELTDVTFHGVLAYYLKDGLEGILFDIEEVPYSRVAEEHQEAISAGRNYGWPFRACRDDPAAFVKAQGAKVFRIQSSTMFDGFVVCERMVVADSKTPDEASSGGFPA